jgi:hypothetical protein
MNDETRTNYLDTSMYPKNFKDFIIWCQKKYTEIPIEHQDTASVCIYEDDGSAILEISYRIPVTEEYKASRRRFQITDASNTIKYLKIQYPELANL